MPRTKGKRFLLTYSQFDCEFIDLFNFLDEFAGGISKFRIGRERHADGEPHIHVAVEFARQLDRRGDTAHRVFDFNGHHPNIQPKRTKNEWKNAWDYPCKDGKEWLDFLEYSEEDSTLTDEEDNRHAIGNPDFDEIEAAQNAASWTEFLRECRLNGIPHGYAAAQWNSRGTDLRTITDDNLQERIAGRSIDSPILQQLRFEDNGKTWILEGRTGIGKTTWALTHMPKPALWCTDVDSLKSFRPGYHKSIIFDDISFAHIPREKQLSIVDIRDGRDIRCRYICAPIPAGVHKCFTCNDGPLDFPVTRVDPAINRRLHVITI